jgi:hypothetical protein
MPISFRNFSPWTREHDDPAQPHIPQAATIVYPESLEELIDLCETRPPNQRLHAAGSHWALSEAAISDHTFVETHDPNDAYPALGRTLYDVVPSCLNPELLEALAFQPSAPFTLVHVEAGKRVYQLYAELDRKEFVNLGANPDPNNPGNARTLAAVLFYDYLVNSYRGPWGLRTLGDSGGQTVVGALTTGTHGGDWREGPIADSVVALHLVADGGKHYWIEPEIGPLEKTLTNDEKLRDLYDVQKYGSAPGLYSNFEIIRNNDVFNAVLISAGRFGIIYSVVLAALPQYSLHEERNIVDWQDIKAQINFPTSSIYNGPFLVPDGGGLVQQEFLQIAVCLTPYHLCSRNLAGVTRRWRVFPPLTDKGRAERVGTIGPFDPQIQAARFSHAGKSHPYNPNPDPESPTAGNPTFLELACADSSFLRGVLKQVNQELRDFVESNGGYLGAAIPQIAAAGGTGLIALAPWLLAISELLDDFLDQFDLDGRLGGQLERIKDLVLGGEDEPVPRGVAGIFVWQLIAYLAFQLQQHDRTYDAISYAVMETHDYREQSCRSHVDSIEVFFDATDNRVLAFVDALIEFERQQEFVGKAFIGYASLRFVGKTRALIGMERHKTTCAIEVACLRDVSGSQELLDYAVTLARSPLFNGIFHWGQRNDCTRPEIERRFGDDLEKWRKALSLITDNGRLDGFSSEFTRRTGLEVVQPKIGFFGASTLTVHVGQIVIVTWNCVSNPPGTTIKLAIQDPNGNVTTDEDLPLDDERPFTAAIAGSYIVVLTAILGKRQDAKSFAVTAS